MRYFLHQAVLFLTFGGLRLLPLLLPFVLLLLSLVFFEHLAVIFNLLLEGGVDTDATTTASTTLLPEAFVFFLELSDKLVLSGFIDFGFVFYSFDLPSITKGSKGLIKVD